MLNFRIAAITGKRRRLLQVAPDRRRKGKKRRNFIRYALIILLIFMLCGIVFFAAGNGLIACCSNAVFDDIEQIPEYSTALVLGCSPNIGSRRNLFFRFRMEQAAALYHSGKVEKLLLSGDNGRKGYNEPEAMRQALIAAGVPDSVIYCDYAGFSTLDSIIRAKEVFGLQKFIVVSQRFHCERAVFLARAKGLECCGSAAKDVEIRYWKIRNHFRESLARPAALLDLLINRPPRFTGKKVDMSVPQQKAG